MKTYVVTFDTHYCFDKSVVHIKVRVSEDLTEAEVIKTAADLAQNHEIRVMGLKSDTGRIDDHYQP